MAASGSGNNRFGLACARMRQYMMERNRLARMGEFVGSSSFQRPLQLTPFPVPTGLAANWDSGDTALSLFPGGTGKEIVRPEEDKAGLTIFYRGQVATFHNFPADRANDLMQMAVYVTGKAPEIGVTTAVPDEPSAAEAALPPIARKRTLQRFLSKRKNRTGGTDHLYQNEDVSPQKKIYSARASYYNLAEGVPDDAASWLSL